MKLAECSINRFFTSTNYWRVPEDYSQPMFNYLVHGYSPGSFFSSILFNEWTAILYSHPSNDVPNLKSLTKWLVNVAPYQAWGNREKVAAYMELSDSERRAILESLDLIYTEKQEVIEILKK